MSKQQRTRDKAIDTEFDAVKGTSATVVSSLVGHTARLKLFITFLHDDLLNGKGDLAEGDRVELRQALAPLYPQIQECLDELTDLFDIHDEDPAVWQANFDAFLIKNPDILAEALNRFPKVG